MHFLLRSYVKKCISDKVMSRDFEQKKSQEMVIFQLVKQNDITWVFVAWSELHHFKF